MAKMFYSLQEAASKLKKSESEVRQMAARGEITEFRDGDKLIFKVDQIDLLAGDDESADPEMSSMIPLADTGASSAMGYGLEESSAGSFAPSASGGSSAPGASGIGSGLMGGSGFPVEASGGSGSGMSAKERSGVPVFDVDELEEADPSAVTQVTDGGIDGGFTLESIGSGSGLMDLTRESDDTSLGAEGLLDELYSKEDAGGDAAAGSSMEEGSGLFESAPSAGDLSGVEGAVIVAAEPYDGVGSGVAGGLAFGMIVAAALALVIVLTSMTGLTLPFFASIGGEMAPLVWVGILAGVMLLATGIGFVMGKRTA